MHASALNLLLASLLLSRPDIALPAQASEGVRRVTSSAYVYTPDAAASPAPVIVLLHGAGGNARSFLNEFMREADARGFVLLSVQSAGRTWALRKPSEKEADVVNIKAAIQSLASTAPVNLKRVTAMGFSDGASYALSVGMAYPRMFRSIVAFSPGYAFAPTRLDTGQRIFIAHSRRDRVLPAENTREMVKGLESAGFKPEVHWFNGGHEIDPKLKQAGIDFALRP